MKKIVAALLFVVALPLFAFAEEAVDFKGKNAPLDSWLTIGGDYTFRFDSLTGKVPAYWQASPNFSFPPGTSTPFAFQVPAMDVKNDTLYSNRFGLDLKAKATKDVTVTARLLMYKFAGAQDSAPINGYSFDRAGQFDGTVGHVPGSSALAVDRVYATWNNVLGQPVWFSIGRRPSTDGVPIYLKQNKEKPGNSGVPALLVNYAFDGVTLGYAPDIEGLPGAYAKLCYGRGFQDGIESKDNGNGVKNTDLVGLNIVPFDTDPLRIELQYNRGMDIFDAPTMLNGPFSQLLTGPATNLGDIDWYGIDFLGKVKDAGPGVLNWFVDGAMSQTHPNENTLFLCNPFDPSCSDGVPTGAGLLYTGMPKSTTGWAAYAGLRYDLPTGTKIGAEYNHGSKNWITFAPSADDMWTSKVGVRGDVYEGYLIQELPLKPVSSVFSKAFFKVGYQYYSFDYSGSNSWLGAPIEIDQLNATFNNAQMTTPLEKATDIYATFEVHF